MAKIRGKAVEINAELAEAAILGLEMKRRELDEKIAELRSLALSGTSGSTQTAGTRKKRRPFSTASRKKMAEAQRKRWAAIRGDSGAESKPSSRSRTPTKKNKGTRKTAKKGAAKTA